MTHRAVGSIGSEQVRSVDRRVANGWTAEYRAAPHSWAFNALRRRRVGVLRQQRGLRMLGSNPSCAVIAMYSPSEVVPFPNPEETWATSTMTKKDLEQMVDDQV